MFKKFVFASAAVALFWGVFAQPPAVDEKTALQLEALNRLKGADLESNEALKAAILRVLEKTQGTPQFVDIVRDFGLKGQGTALLDYALSYPKETSAIEAFRLALKETGTNILSQLVESTNAVPAIQLVGNSKEKEWQPFLEALVLESKAPVAARKAAVQALAGSEDGAKYLLALARENRLPADVKFAASSELNLAPWPEIKKQALELLPLPQAQNAEPLPPVAEMVKRTGDVKRGAGIFASEEAACAYCHVVNGKGIDVGPQLSEIGTKLGKEALYEAILDPSSGISFGYEAWSIETQSGDEYFGLITSETPEEVTIKSQSGVVTKIKKSEIARRQKMSSSLMPTGLQLTMSTGDLVDLVEFLSSLKKAAPTK